MHERGQMKPMLRKLFPDSVVEEVRLVKENVLETHTHNARNPLKKGEKISPRMPGYDPPIHIQGVTLGFNLSESKP